MSTSRFLLFGTSLFRSHKPSSPFPSTFFIKPFPARTLNIQGYAAAAAIITSSNTEVLNTRHHPWPEWVSFVDRLKSKGYLIGDGDGDSVGDSENVYKDINLLKDACLNFARDRYDIFKSLSGKDIQTVVESGCPNLFRKPVNSAKRLRVYVQLDEGDVCGACSLRGSCDRAYVIVKESEAAARTVDIVRILLFYALDPLLISGGEKPEHMKIIEESAKKLLAEFIELSDSSPAPAIQEPAAKVSRKKEKIISFTDNELSQDVEMKRGDWTCPKCNFLNFSRNMRCLKCKEDGPKRADSGDVEMKKGDWVCQDCSFMNFSRNVKCLRCKAEGPKRVGVNDVEMKKGDWNCTQCRFMNFASNAKCLRCRDPRPKRQLNPGEWECPSCDFLNYKKNMFCLKCNCDRPKESSSEYEEQLWRKPK